MKFLLSMSFFMIMLNSAIADYSLIKKDGQPFCQFDAPLSLTNSAGVAQIDGFFISIHAPVVSGDMYKVDLFRDVSFESRLDSKNELSFTSSFRASLELSEHPFDDSDGPSAIKEKIINAFISKLKALLSVGG